MNDETKRQRFQTAYEGQPPWDLGRPQKPFMEHADEITGDVLDTGCGTGDNALFFAQRGQSVLGIDFVEKPLELARRKADELAVQAEFLAMDALKLKELRRTFDSVLDCGLFHVFADEDRLPYVEGLAHVVKDGGRLFLMCFSDEEPAGPGPRRISRAELEQAFADGWAIESVAATRFEPNPNADQRYFDEDGPRAWFAVIRRKKCSRPVE